MAGLSSTIQGQLASDIKSLEDVNYLLHKIAHAAAGCVAGAIQKSCEAGAIGAAVGEIVADELKNGRYAFELNAAEKSKIETLSKLIAGTVSAYAGYDVNVAANSAQVAINNNALSDDFKKFAKDAALKVAGGVSGSFVSFGSIGLPVTDSEVRQQVIEGIKLLATSDEPLVMLKLGMIAQHEEFKNLDALMAMNNDTFGRAMVDAKYATDVVQILVGVAALPKAVVTVGKVGSATAGYVINGTKVIVRNGDVSIAKTADDIKFVNTVSILENSLKLGETKVINGIEQTRVGRWMSTSELNLMQDTGRVVEGAGGQTFISTLGASDYKSIAQTGSIYVEFNIPTSSLIQGGKTGWFKMIGPNAAKSQQYLLKKQGGEQLPSATYIKMVDRK